MALQAAQVGKAFSCGRSCLASLTFHLVEMHKTVATDLLGVQMVTRILNTFPYR